MEIYKNEKKIAGNFEIDEYYFTLNSPFLTAKWVKTFQTFTVYSTSIRKALKLENIYLLFYLITNDGASVIALVKFGRKKLCYEVQFWKNFSRQFFSPIHGEYFYKILIRSVNKYSFYEQFSKKWSACEQFTQR